MQHNRRAFLKTLSLATTGTMLMGPWDMHTVNAATKYPRNFIFCYFNGGWDQLLSLDPRNPKTFTDSSADIKKYQVELGYKRLATKFEDGSTLPRNIIRPSGSNISFGPAMAPFAKHYNQSCVVRGVMMDTVAHDIGRRYFVTGEMPAGLAAKGSSWGTRIVAQEGEGNRQIPNLVLRVETYNKNLPTFATGLKATSTTDLIKTLRKGPDALPAEYRKLLDDYRIASKNCDPTVLDEEGMMALVQQAQKKAKSLVDSGLGDYFDFLNKSKPEMVKIKNRYNIASSTDAGAQAALAFQSIKHGLAQCVTIELARGLDTHVNNWATDQPNIQQRGWKALATLVDDLKKEKHPDPTLANKGKTLLDNTTIMCFSEFARTPKINSKDGRDHFLVSSCLLVGAGIPHNKVIGKTADIGMSAYQVNPNTGAAVKTGGVFLNPQNILASIMTGAGYDSSDLREKPLKVLSNGKA